MYQKPSGEWVKNRWADEAAGYAFAFIFILWASAPFVLIFLILGFIP